MFFGERVERSPRRLLNALDKLADSPPDICDDACRGSRFACDGLDRNRLQSWGDWPRSPPVEPPLPIFWPTAKDDDITSQIPQMRFAFVTNCV